MEESRRETGESLGAEKSTGPTYTRFKCCSDKAGCTGFQSWTEAGECYERGGRLARNPVKDE